MYRIAILMDNEVLGRQLADWTKQFYAEQGRFPLIEIHKDSKTFFNRMKDMQPSGVIVVISGVAGLNAVEHLYSLNPNCRLIWCSDLDFSLHAYRLRAEYFILSPVTDVELQRGLACWQEKHGYWNTCSKKNKQGRYMPYSESQTEEMRDIVLSVD